MKLSRKGHNHEAHPSQAPNEEEQYKQKQLLRDVCVCLCVCVWGGGGGIMVCVVWGRFKEWIHFQGRYTTTSL